jgi:hypothetical protein
MQKDAEQFLKYKDLWVETQACGMGGEGDTDITGAT